MGLYATICYDNIWFMLFCIVFLALSQKKMHLLYDHQLDFPAAKSQSKLISDLKFLAVNQK